MTEIMDVSSEQAREWDVVVKSRRDGDAGVRVWLEFKTKGKWEKFSQVKLIVRKELGKPLATVPLPVDHSTPDTLAAGFSAQPSMLEQCEFWVYVNDIPRGGTAYRIKLRDFVKWEESTEVDPQGGAGQPASVRESKSKGNENVKPKTEGRPQ